MTHAPESQKISYPFPTVPEPGAALEVAPGVHWVRMPLPFALNHINLWLMEDGDGWTVVDTGYGVEKTWSLWERVLAGHTGGRPVRRVIVTHYHPDHVGSAGWLCERCGAELWMTEAEYLTAHAMRSGIAGMDNAHARAHYRRHGLDAVRLKAQEVRGNAYVQGVPSLPHTYRRLLDGDEIAIGRNIWRVVTVYGHAPEHAALYCAGLGALISGDQVLPRITTNVGVWGNQPEGNSLKRYLDSLARFEPLPRDTLVLPSHDRVFLGLHARIEQLRAHHEARLNELERACEEPRSAAELLPVLFKRELDDHQLMFAMGETIAHLNYLMYAGRLVRKTGEDGVHRFASA